MLRRAARAVRRVAAAPAKRRSGEREPGRVRAALRPRLLPIVPVRLRPGVTVVVVYYRTPELIRVCLDQLEKHATPDLREVMVVDNGSGDGVVRSLSHPLARPHVLRRNYGHGWALDWAARRVRTRYLVTLDSDAWPVSDDWLPALLGALEGGAAAAGITYFRDYLRPACLAIETRTVRRYGLSFLRREPPSWQHEELGTRYWDVGEAVTMELRRRGLRLHGIPADGDPEGERDVAVGRTYGGIVYHLWAATRVQNATEQPVFRGVPRELVEDEMRRWISPPAGQELETAR